MTFALACAVIASASATAAPRDERAGAEDVSDTPAVPADVDLPNPLAVVHFASGSASLDEPDLEALEEVVVWMREHPTRLVFLEGHADRTGGRAANLELAWRRADAVHDDLVALGAEAARLVSISYGEDDATADREASRNVVVRSSTQTYGSLIQSQRPGRVETYVEERRPARDAQATEPQATSGR